MTGIAVMVSGTGTNCENIIRHFARSDKARVRLVVSSRPDAPAVERARRLGVPAVAITKAQLQDEAFVTGLLRSHDVSFIALAGFLLMVPPFVVNSFRGRIVNIHPSLLPKFGGKGMYGIHVHQAVRDAGEEVTGITIHYVSEQCDAGDIIFQARTAISGADTVGDIAAKVHKLEMDHYPRVIESLL